jgi:DNA-binding MarR family transcriptional regulator
MSRRSSIPNSEAFALLVADVFDAAGVLRRYGERIAGTAGQTQARWQLLSVISEGEWTVPMAADRLGTSRQAVQRIANDLVADDAASFVDNPRHRRSPFLRLTEKGTEALAAITKEAERSHEALAAKLGSLNVVEVRSALRQVTTSVRAELPENSSS